MSKVRYDVVRAIDLNLRNIERWTMSRSTHYVVTVLSSYTPNIVADCNVLPFPSERIQISAPALPRLSQYFTTIMAPQLPWSDET